MQPTNFQVNTSPLHSDKILTKKLMLKITTLRIGHVFNFSFQTFRCFAATNFTVELPAFAASWGKILSTEQNMAQKLISKQILDHLGFSYLYEVKACFLGFILVLFTYRSEVHKVQDSKVFVIDAYSLLIFAKIVQCYFAYLELRNFG